MTPAPVYSMTDDKGEPTELNVGVGHSRENRLLRLNASGAFTYLSSEPGQYIRFTRLHDRIAYVDRTE